MIGCRISGGIFRLEDSKEKNNPADNVRLSFSQLFTQFSVICPVIRSDDLSVSPAQEISLQRTSRDKEVLFGSSSEIFMRDSF